jgi:hypothetical protein
VKFLWLERFLWMIVGTMLVTFIRQNFIGLGFLTVGWLLPVPARNSLLLEQAHDLGMALMQLTLWATAILILWKLATNRPRLGAWIRRTLEHHPLKAAVGIVVLLHVGFLIAPLFSWSGLLPGRTGKVYGFIGSEWYQWSWIFTDMVAPAVLFIVLVRWRMKLRKA